MKTILYSIGAALLLIVSPPAAFAQQSLSFGLAGGASVPSGDFPGEYGTGYHILATLGFGDLARPLAFRLDGMANRFGGELVAGGAGRKYIDHSIYAFTGNTVYTVPGAGVRPYVIGGAGYYNQNGAIANHNLGLNAGVGIRFRLGGAGAFVEARYHNFLALDLSGAPRPPARFAPISIGITF